MQNNSVLGVEVNTEAY